MYFSCLLVYMGDRKGKKKHAKQLTYFKNKNKTRSLIQSRPD